MSIILAVVLFFSVIALLGLDEGKEKDTILYAKFLRVDDPIRNWIYQQDNNFITK